jgi:hypothetical protein
MDPRHACAVCGYLTLETDDAGQICVLCDWAVGQQVEAERGQPGAYALDEARANFQQHLTFRRPDDPSFGVETQPEVVAAKQALRAALDQALTAESGEGWASAEALAVRLGRVRSLAEAFAFEAPEDVVIALGDLLAEKCEALGLNWQTLSSTEKIVWFILGLDEQMNSGGFYQFFFNEEGDYALELLPVFYKLRAIETTMLYEAALAFFPNSRPAANQDGRWEQLERLSDEDVDRLNELSERYQQLTVEENLYALALPILKARSREFLW